MIAVDIDTNLIPDFLTPEIIIAFLIIICLYFYCRKTYKIIEINDANKKEYSEKLKNFESRLGNWYSLGNDYFRIDHGTDYFKFFERQGDMKMLACIDDENKVIGNVCGILKTVGNKKFWYICDLKIDKQYRGQHIPSKMFLQGLKYTGLANAGYAIVMDGENANKVKRLSQIGGLLQNYVGAMGPKLYIYSLNCEQMIRAMNIVVKHRGNIYFKSLTGVKDLVLKSNNSPMNILHIEYMTEEFIGERKMDVSVCLFPIEDHQHMFCCLENEEFKTDLDNAGFKTNITATIIYCNMNNQDWKFIKTSDI